MPVRRVQQEFYQTSPPHNSALRLDGAPVMVLPVRRVWSWRDRTWGHSSGHVPVLFDRPYLRDTYLPSLAHTYFSGSETLDYN